MAAFNLRKAEHHVDEAEDGQSGLAAFRPDEHALVITDVRMPGMGGIEVTKRIGERAPLCPVVVITAYGDVEIAVEAMKAGAYDFMQKPFSREQLQLVVNRALEHRRLTLENQELRRQVRGVERPMTYRSAIMKDTVAIIDRVAPSDASVLVTGESGTGKELAARRIHARSHRGEEPFVVVNCAGIPAELIEAELFGHEKGAFTGAARARVGRFRQADKGSIFLDEIAELPLASQGKLLRVLQEGVVDVLGGDEAVRVDVRVIAATNRDLRAEVQAGRFREDLYFRLNVVEIRMPPLRARREDITELAATFVAELSGGECTTLPREVAAAILSRNWTGNVRELRNACERMVILSPKGTLSVAALPAEGAPVAGGGLTFGVDSTLQLPQDGISLVELEKAVIEQALLRTGGNVSRAARFLRIPRHILVYRIEKYGIARQESS